MRHIQILAAVLLAAFVLADVTEAQNRKAGLNGAAFLKIGVGARQVGLGSAVTSLTDDVTNMFWNPAGIALKEGEMLQASFTYNKWFADLTQNAAAVSYRLEDIGTIGVGFMSFGVSGIPSDRDLYPDNPDLAALQIDQSSGDYDYLDLLLMATYSRYITDRLSLGVSFKYISEKIDDQTASAVAFDFGSVYDIGVLGWKIGARLNNLGGDLTFYDFPAALPLTFSIGTSIVPIDNDMSRFMIALDGVKPQDGLQYYFLGGEFTLMKLVSVRGGYKFNYSGMDDGGNSTRDAINTTVENWSAGAGFMVDLSGLNVRVDYGYTDMDLVDVVHRVSVSVGLK